MCTVQTNASSRSIPARAPFPHLRAQFSARRDHPTDSARRMFGRVPHMGRMWYNLVNVQQQQQQHQLKNLHSDKYYSTANVVSGT